MYLYIACLKTFIFYSNIYMKWMLQRNFIHEYNEYNFYISASIFRYYCPNIMQNCDMYEKDFDSKTSASFRRVRSIIISWLLIQQAPAKLVNYELFVSTTLYRVFDKYWWNYQIHHCKTKLIVCFVTARRSVGWTTRPIVVICGAVVVLVVVGAVWVRVVITISGRRVCAAWGCPGISLWIGTGWSWRHRFATA